MGQQVSDTKPKTQGIYGTTILEEVKEAVNFARNRGTTKGIISEIELHISCTNLKNVDVGSLTDSACVVFVKNKKYIN